MQWFRRSRVRSTRGHVRIDEGPSWDQWILWGVGVVALVLVLAVVITQAILPLFEDDEVERSSRTWLEFAWVNTAPSPDAVRQLGELLQENEIERVYLEVAAWRSDGTLLEGEYVTDFVQQLRAAAPDISILAWLRMSGPEIQNEERQAAVVALTRKTMQWGFDGVQLNGRTVYNDSESYIVLVRALRETIGPGKILSLTVPPDRLPADPDVPLGTTGDPDLTWTLSYKQRVGLLAVDEVVVMAHASGLTAPEDYQMWVAYQVEAYAQTMNELEQPPDVIIALPTYDEAPEHDPAVENITSAIQGVKDGLKQAGDASDLVRGVGLYEYKTTESREWILYAEQWLERASN